MKPTTLEWRIKKLGLTRTGTLALLPWMVGKLAAWSTLVETIRYAV